MRRKETPLPSDVELTRLALLIRRSGAAIRLEHALRTPGKKGRRRHAPVELFLLIAIVLLSTKQAVRGQDVESLIESGDAVRLRRLLDALPGLRPGPHLEPAAWKPITIHQWRRFWGSIGNLRYRDVFELTNMLLLGWLPMQPPLGDRLLFDATTLETHARPVAKAVRLQLLKEGSSDLLLQSERELPLKEQRSIRAKRTHQAHDAVYGHATTTRKQAKALVGGFHLHLVVCSTDRESDAKEPATAPTLILATDLTPASGYSAPDQLLTLLTYVDRRFDLTDGFVVVADRDYSKKHDIWNVLRNLRQPFAFDLRVNQLRPRGEHHGALLAQGNALCCATPRNLRNPGKKPPTTIGASKAPNPKYKKWLKRVRKQDAYRCHTRSIRDHGINVACPALPPSPKVDCALRKLLDRDSRRPVVLEPPSPHHAPPICTQKTVFIPDTVNTLRQTTRWGTPAWLRIYQKGRAHNEGIHGELKHPQGYGLDRETTASSRRNVVAIHVALIETLLNYDKVWEFIRANPNHGFSKVMVEDPLFIDLADPPDAA